jgi:hypothetical protein
MRLCVTNWQRETWYARTCTGTRTFWVLGVKFYPTNDDHHDDHDGRRLTDNQLCASINCIPDSGYIYHVDKEKEGYM